MKNNQFGKNLKSLRKANDLTQRELGKKLNVHYNTISSWELGRREPDLDTLVLMTKVLDASFEDLILD